MNPINRHDTVAFPEVPIARLRWRCDPHSLPFASTDDVAPEAGLIGQERARKALLLGMEINHAGYNVYVSGDAGTGKLAAVQQIAAQLRNSEARPPDLCYVYGFKNPECPRLLALPAGQGAALKKAMQDLIEGLKEDIPKALAGADCQHRKARCLDRYQRREQRLVAQLEARLAPAFGLVWQGLDMALAAEVAPVLEGRLTPMAELEERVDGGGFDVTRFRDLRTRQETLNAASADVLVELGELRQKMQEDLRTLERAAAKPVVREAVAEVEKLFDAADVKRYLQDAEAALNEESERFHPAPPGPSRPGAHAAAV